VLSIEQNEIPAHRAVCIKLIGSVELDSIDVLSRAVSDLIRRKPSAVVIDLSKLAFASSLALGALVELRRQLHAQGGHVALVGVSDQLRTGLRMTRLDSFFRIHTTLEEALVPSPTAAQAG
jgi:anti-anti-sigma factor